jgi:hypothetical protein
MSVCYCVIMRRGGRGPRGRRAVGRARDDEIVRTETIPVIETSSEVQGVHDDR